MRRNNGVSRSDRINSELKKEIYDIISRKLKNPLITEMFSIMAVDCANDLSFAKVYVSVFSTNKEKSQTTFEAIKADAKKIRFELAKVVRARTVPELKFILDGSMEYGDKMDKLFKQISEEK